MAIASSILQTLPYLLLTGSIEALRCKSSLGNKLNYDELSPHFPGEKQKGGRVCERNVFVLILTLSLGFFTIATLLKARPVMVSYQGIIDSVVDPHDLPDGFFGSVSVLAELAGV